MNLEKKILLIQQHGPNWVIIRWKFKLDNLIWSKFILTNESKAIEAIGVKKKVNLVLINSSINQDKFNAVVISYIIFTSSILLS